jgi:hypothetical protein
MTQLLSLSGIVLDFFAYAFLLSVIYAALEKCLKRKILYAFSAIAVIRLFLDYGNVFSFSFLQYFAVLFGFFILIKYSVFELGREFFSNAVKIADLKPGMVPAEMIYPDKGGFRREPLGFAAVPAENAFFSARHLTPADIRKLAGLHRSGKIGPALRVHQTMPFAPFMFLGVLLSLAFQGSVLAALVQLKI